MRSLAFIASKILTGERQEAPKLLILKVFYGKQQAENAAACSAARK